MGMKMRAEPWLEEDRRKREKNMRSKAETFAVSCTKKG